MAAGTGAAAALGVGGTGGATIGHASEDAMAEGIPKDDVFFYRYLLKQGRSVVLVNCDEQSQVAPMRTLLDKSGSENVEVARKQRQESRPNDGAAARGVMMARASGGLSRYPPPLKGLSEIKDLETNLRKYGVPKDLAQKATLGDFCVLQRFAGCGAFGHEGLRHREDGRGTNYRCVCLPYWFGITGKLFARQKAKVTR